jgi:hypothetical protein
MQRTENEEGWRRWWRWWEAQCWLAGRGNNYVDEPSAGVAALYLNPFFLFWAQGANAIQPRGVCVVVLYLVVVVVDGWRDGWMARPSQKV